MVEKARIRPSSATVREQPGPSTSAKRLAWTSKLRGRGARAVLALAAPCVSAAFESLLWPILHPFSWFLFYPAVFFSAWIGGFWGGVGASLLSTLLAWWMFVPPAHTFFKENLHYLLPTMVFFLMGMVFSVFQAYLQRTARRAKEALAESLQAAERLQRAYDDNERLIEQASDGILIGDLSGRILEANSAACSMLGYSRDEMREQRLTSLVLSTEAERLVRVREELERGGLHIQEWDLRRKKGGVCNVEVSAKILLDGRWQMFLRDVSERKFAQARLLRVLRANRALSRCNQALIRAADVQTLLQQVCDVVVHDAGYLLCWAGRAEHDERKSVRVLALSGNGAEYVASLKVTWGEDELGQGPTGVSIRTRQTVTSRNIAGDRAMEPWRIGALQHGYASSLAIPLMDEEAEVFGSLNIYAEDPDAFHTEEVELLQELAEDLAFGIRTLQIREQRKQAEEGLRARIAALEQRLLEGTQEPAGRE